MRKNLRFVGLRSLPAARDAEVFAKAGRAAHVISATAAGKRQPYHADGRCVGLALASDLQIPRSLEPVRPKWRPHISELVVVLSTLLLSSCRTAPAPDAPVVAAPVAPVPVVPPRTDDVIIAAGRRFHAGTRVVTWLEKDGYSAYRGAPPFAPRQSAALSAEETARVKDRGWDLPTLQKVVDQFVLHYDASGLSSICFDVLRERAGLSVHFMLDVDGTIYQTLDLQERAAHATVSNSRSIGIEIANIGAYPPSEAAPLGEWYARDTEGGVTITVPKKVAAPRIRTPNFVGRPARPALVRGAIHGKPLVQYDFTPEQYAALAKLTAALCRVFPGIVSELPRDASGRVLATKLPDPELAKYRGILGHFHIQENKVDPGPAFQWERLLDEVRADGP